MKKHVILLTTFFLLSSSLAWAQRPPELQEREKRREKMEALRIWKMLEILDLSQAQSDKFLPALREMQKKEAKLHQERRMLLRNLEEILAEGGDPGQVRNIIDELRGLGKKAEQVREEFFNQAEGILSVQQLGKLILFQDRFERRMRGMMRELREEGRPKFQSQRRR